MFEGKSINDITEQDLQGLIGISSEVQNVDFKSDAYQIPINIPEESKRDIVTRSKRIALCTDISAIANVAGGWIICGIEETDGTATKLTGIKTDNAEEEVKRLEQIARAGIEPYPSGVLFRAIPLANAKNPFAIVIFIPRSYNAPHRVKETGKFHVRRSNGNSDMTMDELRYQFTFAQAISERIRVFRKERVEALLQPSHEEIPVALKHGLKIALHIVPLAAFESRNSIDISVFGVRNPPYWTYTNGWGAGRYNLEGYALMPSSQQNREGVTSYIQIFRNGVIECVEVLEAQKAPDGYVIFLGAIESIVLNFFDAVLPIYLNLCTSPTIITLSIINVEGKIFETGLNSFAERNNHRIPISKRNLLIPDIFVEDINQDIPIIMKPAFDILWNAASFPNSLSYKPDGKHRYSSD